MTHSTVTWKYFIIANRSLSDNIGIPVQQNSLKLIATHLKLDGFQIKFRVINKQFNNSKKKKKKSTVPAQTCESRCEQCATTIGLGFPRARWLINHHLRLQEKTVIVCKQSSACLFLQLGKAIYFRLIFCPICWISLDITQTMNKSNALTKKRRRTSAIWGLIVPALIS